MVNELRKWIEASNNIVFFGGAGVSTESGIPDFRGTGGLYNQHYKFPPETILSKEFFQADTKEFYRFYKNKMIFPNAEPNKAHIALSQLERAGKLRAVITQNIDGLHQKAGSENVLELHGSVYRNHCIKCRASFNISVIMNNETDIPTCFCGGIIKPDVVLYGEGLDYKTMREAAEHIANADVFIIGGTSLGVYPAAGLAEYYRGDKLVLINRTATHMDRSANLVIREPIGEVLAAVMG